MKYFLLIFIILISASPVFAEDDTDTVISEPIATPNIDVLQPEKVEELQPDEIKLDDSITDENAASDTIADEKSSNKKDFDGIDHSLLNTNYKSLFYTDEEIDLLYARIKRYRESKKDINKIVSESAPISIPTNKLDLGEGLFTNENDNRIVTFFLGSILFSHDGNWTIWLNDQRVRKEDKDHAEVEIMNVSNDSVIMLYKVARLDTAAPDYTDKLIRIPDGAERDSDYNWDYISEDKNILVSSSENIVKFKLGLRQTFLLNEMRIMEGKYSTTPILVEGESGNSALQAVIDQNVPVQASVDLNQNNANQYVDKMQQTPGQLATPVVEAVKNAASAAAEGVNKAANAAANVLGIGGEPKENSTTPENPTPPVPGQ